MASVSLTTFVDFVSATGTARLTRVREAKRFYDQGYAPERDFYKPLRDAIEATFEEGWSATTLKKQVFVSDPKKVENYEECRQGLSKWVGKKKIKLLSPVRKTWKRGSLEVTLNPELHLEVNGEPHLVKLYLKSDPLSKQKANLVLHLLSKATPSGAIPAILDVRRSKLFTPTVAIDDLDVLLDAEAAAFEAMWEGL